MCIAILSEGNVPLPDEATLKRCWRNNSDGAGYAFLTTEDKWHCHKGFKKWKDFRNAFYDENFQPEHTVIIHFRVGTSGAMLPNNGGCHPDCTHPFPITKEEAMLNVHEFETDTIIMHNGVHSRPTGILSDTQIAVRDLASPLIPYFEKDENIRNLMCKVLESNRNRWFIGVGSNYYLLGDWVKDEKTEIWYSNDGFKPYIPTVVAKGATAMHNWRSVFKPDSESKNVFPLYGRFAYEFCAGGEWSWDKWNAKEEESKQDTPDNKSLIAVDGKGDVDDAIDVLYDHTGNVIALIDKNGDTVWDDVFETEHNEEADPDDPWTCPDCNALQTVGDLEHGKCMFCHGSKGRHCPHCEGVLWDPRPGDICPWCYEELEVDDVVDECPPCPNCKEANHLIESTYDRGDTECMRCGALYMNNTFGMDAIVGWNQETKKMHDDFMRIVMDKGGLG